MLHIGLKELDFFSSEYIGLGLIVPKLWLSLEVNISGLYNNYCTGVLIGFFVKYVFPSLLVWCISLCSNHRFSNIANISSA